MGIAAALLVFTGIWHALEWAMGGRNPDTARLVPVGILYAVLGWMIALGSYIPSVAWIALVVTILGLTAAFVGRTTLQVRGWVIWTFIVIDMVIIGGLLSGLLL